ncbi:TetR/AcrR family transcriptional regulator [Natronomonas salina]|uniref:TetR/AcrR family transcriptional regulator n=1 Tax=Natronomonas salina TaxID=1710540 RepID=UPI0015B3A180|nr:TetR/AcrR family transcriptional regulator [Natronomonas salina]QLD88243.1 TetR/AcrR family transcriptional regulator [Natronomonas salina]
MRAVESFLESPEGTREEIMRATYLALCTHGYADLTVQRIGEEFPKSKSLIYHHYDGKDDLLLDFLSFMLDRFRTAMPFPDAAGPREHLEAILDYVLATPLPEDRREFTRAMVQLRAQATHDEDYRAHFTRHDRFVVDSLEAIIDRGVAAGHFRPVDAEAVAAFLLVTFNGSMLQQVTSEPTSGSAVRDELDAYLQAVLLADD